MVYKYSRQAFTVIELLLVIVILAIIATLAIISYSGVTNRASVSSLQADVTNSIKQIKLYHAEFSAYPLTFDSNNCPLTPVASTIYCLKFSVNNSLKYYQADNTSAGDYFAIIATNSNSGSSVRGSSTSNVANGSFNKASCLAILNAGESSGNGVYWIQPGVAPSPFPVFCDMTTNGGGWTIVTSQSGTSTAENGLVSDIESLVNPFSSKAYNISLLKKEYISSVSTESLIKRVSSGKWIKVNRALFDDNLTGAGNSDPHWSVTVTDSTGVIATNSTMGYSNYNISNGGDFGITTSGTTFDHHLTSYWHLKGGCVNMYFYKYGKTYNVNTALGDWSVTNTCATNNLSMGAWYAGMR